METVDSSASTSSAEGGRPFIGELSKPQRRVLGVLIEKSLTTPEYYPLTMKALVTGCNQKNNRAPLSSYDEFEVESIIDELQKRGLVSTVQTAGGRTERFRHLLRDAVGWGNKQLAIMGELLLRGRQQPGELRTRASRMAPLESQEELRGELERLMQAGYVQSSGDLSRRGIEVDHTLYRSVENKTLDRLAPESEPATSSSPAPPTVREERPAASLPPAAPPSASVSAAYESTRDELQELREQLQALTARVDDLERQLGI